MVSMENTRCAGVSPRVPAPGLTTEGWFALAVFRLGMAASSPGHATYATLRQRIKQVCESDSRQIGNNARSSNRRRMSQPSSVSDNERWERERQFFDRQSQAADLQPVPPETLRRYGVLRRRYFSPEYRYRVIGDLKGKRVLEVGCGEGENSAVLAKLGARVTGIDISQGAIDTALERCRVNGVADQVEFVCSPIELADFTPR